MSEFQTRAEDFCAFMGYLNDDQITSVFVTSPTSRRFRTLTKHHIVFGQALAPVALYLELPARAILTLVPLAKYRDYVCRIESLEIERPIGFDAKSVVLLEMSSTRVPGYSASRVVRNSTTPAQ